MVRVCFLLVRLKKSTRAKFLINHSVQNKDWKISANPEDQAWTLVNLEKDPAEWNPTIYDENDRDTLRLGQDLKNWQEKIAGMQTPTFDTARDRQGHDFLIDLGYIDNN
ncbi:hypothetical protein JXQ70_00660 [bacterium]|nr:hypothetical protein [bacterium]